MIGLGSLTNSFVNNALYYCEGNPILMPLFQATAVSTEMTYSMLSKINIGSSPQSRFDNYVLAYKKAFSQISDTKKIAIVTGANSGIGAITTKALGLAGFHVIMACRNKEQTESAISKLKLETDLDCFEFMELDLASFASINAFIKNFKKSYDKLHLLVNNAGVMMCPYMKTKDGLEMQFGTNHVGHFILTNGLVDTLKASAPARVVVLSSIAHYAGSINKEIITDEKLYNKVKNYGISKLANIMFANELSRRLSGTGVTVNSLHPGSINTNLSRHLDPSASSIFSPVFNVMKDTLLLSPLAGSLTSIMVALSPELEGVTGKYFAHEGEANPLSEALDEAKCKDLWNFTEELIKKHSTN
ncbi:Retinol dehydrogenase 14 [Smittium culicis]|uniref:Retinol dehydrogenase 14 n=1 Tax=Smittium culicis TaxID=133412 RepID=A0A1R1Y232_9FUNG|nr:Retinol dehydrogenase 14 [Smittium culicis]